MSKSIYREIPGAPRLPGSMFDKQKSQKKGLHPVSKICIAVIISMVLLIAALFLSGSTMLHFIHWYWLSAAFASILFAAAAVLVMLGLRKIAKTNWSRLGFTCIMVVVLSFICFGGYFMTAIIFESSEVPVAYIKSDKDDTVVIMRSVNFDSEPNADGSRPLCYTGYQMVNRFFYLVFDYDPIYAPNDIDPAWATEWTPDGDLRLYLPEHEGYVHSEVFITVYDIKNLQQSIESKASLAENATPAPVYAEYPAALPTREPDPFAY